MAIEVIPVIDLAAGRAVHARGGDRARYAPVVSALAPGAAPGDAVALARAYRARLGAARCYVADLDAIAGGAVQRHVLAALAAPGGFGGTLLLDAGARTAADVAASTAVPARAVLGLETFTAWTALETLAASVTVSLDLRDGVALAEGPWGGRAPGVAARWLVERGVRELLLLDLAHVGRGAGPGWDAIDAVRAASAGASLLVGGGVRGEADLVRLAGAGVDGVLVASALHAGALAPGRAHSPAKGSR